MKSYSFLFWGYNVVWIGIAAYVAFLVRKIRLLDHRLDRIERRLPGERDGGQS